MPALAFRADSSQAGAHALMFACLTISYVVGSVKRQRQSGEG